MAQQALTSFMAGDRVVYSDKDGIEERGVVLAAVYLNEGRCMFQADSVYNALTKPPFFMDVF